MKTNNTLAESKETRKKRIKTFIVFSSFLLLFLLFVSIPIFSIRKNIIPIIFSVLFIASSAMYLIFYGQIKIDIVFIFFSIFLIYSCVITLICSKSFSNLKTYITVICLFLFIYEFSININKPKLLLLLYGLSVLIFSIIFLFHYRSSLYDLASGKLDRIGSYFDNENSLGNTFLTGIICCLIFCLGYKNYLLSIPVSIVFSFCCLLTGSRTAIIGVIVTYIVFLFLLFWSKHKLVLFISLSFFVVLLLLVFTVPAFSTLRNRMNLIFSTFFEGEQDQSTINRFSMMMNAFEGWTKSLFFGYGAGGYTYVTGRPSYSHSTISDILINFGLIGSIVFFVPYFLPMIKSRKNTLGKKSLLILILGFILIGLFGTVILQRKCFYLISAIIFSICSFDGLTKPIINISFNRNRQNNFVEFRGCVNND